MIINGKETTADVKLPESEIEESLKEEIGEMVDHEAFKNPVKFMPDCHGGLGPQAIVGFSMKMTDRVVPNTIGGDIGCGMTATRLNGVEVDFDDIDTLRDLNEEVRCRVPMGRGRVNEHEKSFGELYPWQAANDTLRDLYEFVYGRGFDKLKYTRNKFNLDYFAELCDRVGIDAEYAKNSLGSLGGGNHFIEVAEAEMNGDYWIVVHSGSRNLGQKVKSYHQERAIENRQAEVDWAGMTGEHLEYAKSDGSPNYEKIAQDFEGEKIQELGDEIESFTAGSDRNTALDYLTAGEMFPYLKDMVFAQEYATQNRLMMAMEVADALDATITDRINSPHNYIDFQDNVIRKGSTRALAGELFVIPMNMEDGTLLCEGLGNHDWNQSAPHGAGRLGSRGWAHDQFDADEARKRMYENGTYSSNVPGDEVPEAYKDTQLIEQQIKPTANVIDRLIPKMNFKA